MNDLISREALKTIESIQSADFNSIETIREWIDNAPSVPAIPIPDNATNGDVIKIIIPMEDYYGKRAKDFYHFIEWNFSEWWNSPYKRGDTE